MQYSELWKRHAGLILMSQYLMDLAAKRTLSTYAQLGLKSEEERVYKLSCISLALQWAHLKNSAIFETVTFPIAIMGNYARNGRPFHSSSHLTPVHFQNVSVL